MNTIGSVDIEQYLKVVDLTARVLPAASFLEEVRNELRPPKDQQKHPTMLARKARGLEFRPGEVTCWAGYNGHKKSIFTGQVALDLCTQRQRVLVASLEMSPARTMARMCRHFIGGDLPANASIDSFHAWTDDRLWLFDHVGRLDVETCLALCRYFAAELGGQHVFIDSMMMVCTSEERLDEQKQFVTTLCRAAVETGLHVHLITHCRKPASGDDSRPPTKYDIKGTGAISDQASNVITIWSDREKAALIQQGKSTAQIDARPDALVTVEKQRNGAWEGRLMYWFDPHALRFMPEAGDRAEPYFMGNA